MRISPSTKNDIKTGRIDIDSEAFHIFWYMTDKTGNYDSWFTITHEEIKDFCGLCKNTIMDRIGKLEAAGLIERRRPTHKTVEYRVVK